MNTLISIIIPTFNCKEMLSDTLNSIIEQNSKLYECIIVDAASTDGTLEIIRKYAHKYQQIRFISRPDKGIYYAMNEGIGFSEGQYLYFIGAGDKLCKDSLLNIQAFLKGQDIVYGNEYRNKRSKKLYGKKYKDDLIFDILAHQTVFYNRSIFEKVGLYDTKYLIAADQVLNKKIFVYPNIVTEYIDIDICEFLGGGISQRVEDIAYERDYGKIIIENYGKEYIKKRFNYYFNAMNNKRIVAWGYGNQYLTTKGHTSFPIHYFITSSVPETSYFEGKPCKICDSLLEENKDDIFILVFSECYYHEIKKWLVQNYFKEFEHFILMSNRVLDIIRYLD